MQETLRTRLQHEGEEIVNDSRSLPAVYYRAQCVLSLHAALDCVCDCSSCALSPRVRAHCGTEWSWSTGCISKSYGAALSDDRVVFHQSCDHMISWFDVPSGCWTSDLFLRRRPAGACDTRVYAGSESDFPTRPGTCITPSLQRRVADGLLEAQLLLCR